MIEKTTSNKDIIFIYQKDKGILCSSCINNPIDIITAKSCCIKPRAYVLCDFTTLENLNWLDKPPKESETKYFLAKIDIKINDKSLPTYYSVLLRIITETSKYIDQSILLEHWVLHSQYAFYILGTQSTFNSGIYTFKISGVYPIEDLMLGPQDNSYKMNEFNIVLD